MSKGGKRKQLGLYRREDLKPYKYEYGVFTAYFDYYQIVAKPFQQLKAFEYNILVQGLRDKNGKIGDGHLWIKDSSLFRFFKYGRKIEFTAKATTYMRYNGSFSYALTNISNIKIVGDKNDSGIR